MEWPHFVLLLVVVLALSVVLVRDKDNKVFFELLRGFRQSLRYIFELIKSKKLEIQVYNLSIKLN